MKRIIISTLVVIVTLTSVFGQKVKKYDKLFYTNAQVENDDVTISIVSAVATAGELKFKLKIVNKTNDYIIFKPQETKYVAAGTEKKPKEKEMVIGPLDNDSKVINIPGAYNSITKGEYIIDGLYKVAARSSALKTEDYLLPLAKSEFTTGGFNVTSTKVYKQSDATKLSFTVSYTGDNVGCVFTRKPTMMMPDGNEYGCEKPGGTGILLLQKGKSEDFTLTWDRKVGGKAMDMQKVPMTMKWNDTFCEVKPEVEKTITVPFEINLEQSK